MDYYFGFKGSTWRDNINVRDFIIDNYTPYNGDEKFLAPINEKTNKLWKNVLNLYKQESAHNGVLDMDTSIVSSIISHGAGYIDKDLEIIVGLQTDKPLKRGLFINGGLRMAKQTLEDHGYVISKDVEEFFKKHRKTHNEGVFDVYSEEMRKCRSSHIITGLPDAYGRGRIIGDYRRIALYGVDALIDEKIYEHNSCSNIMNEDNIRLKEEIAEQIKALKNLKQLGAIYGFDISAPAKNVFEAIQWTYFGYLAAVKEQNGAAMSLGRVSTFLDIYAERDLKNNIFSEEEIQEFVDQFVIKLRLIKFARTPEYDALFSGDPQWVTESIGGISLNGTHMVSKMSYRFLHTLVNLGPAPEPNLTILWSQLLPKNFKKYCAKISILTSSIQYENDDIMRKLHGDDYAIACCVSSMKLGKEMQFFGARANLAKCLLYAINGGVDEMNHVQIGPKFEKITSEVLSFDEVNEKFYQMMKWLTSVYVNALNVIHYMHDKYCYESLQMALHDKNVTRWFATGIAGLSVVADSLSAIKYAKVYPIRDEQGIATDFKIVGEFPKYGNDDDRVDDIAKSLIHTFIGLVRENNTYRNAIPTTSILTITSNVVYGKFTGSTPDGRKRGESFAPGANPMHCRDENGAVASLASVAKLNFLDAQDGISNTFSIVPSALGKENNYISTCEKQNIAPKISDLKISQVQINNITSLLDGYTLKGGHHLNVNVFNKETLLKAQQHPEKYPQLTIRISGYAVKFNKLTKEQQDEVISRTFHVAL